MIVQRPHTRGNPSQQEIAWIQKPRTVVHSQIFWLNMAVAFTSVANELTQAATEPEGFDCLVRGAWSDITSARVRMNESESDRWWSSDQIPVRSIMGNSTEVHPLLPLPQPVLLEARAQLRGDWINTGTEAAGHACFYTEKAGNDPAGHPYDQAIRVTKSYGFYLLLDLGSVTSTTQPVNSDVLIWGASTNVETSAIIGRIFNETTNYAWSSQQIPIRAMAGVDGQPEPIMRFHRPYLLPNNVQLRAEINTAVTGNYMVLLCERILA
jgi:hypothetical protein